jgi:hypothetical protein
MSAGWLEVLDTYQYLYSLGFRPGMDLSKATLVLPLGNKENASKGR